MYGNDEYSSTAYYTGETTVTVYDEAQAKEEADYGDHKSRDLDKVEASERELHMQAKHLYSAKNHHRARHKKPHMTRRIIN